MPKICGLAIDGSGPIDAPRATSESFNARIDGVGRVTRSKGTGDA
jgi:hypothetical protein